MACPLRSHIGATSLHCGTAALPHRPFRPHRAKVRFTRVLVACCAWRAVTLSPLWAPRDNAMTGRGADGRVRSRTARERRPTPQTRP